MTTITAADTARLESFLATVKAEADSAKMAESGLDSALDSARRDSKAASAAVVEREREKDGFGKPRFTALAKVGAAYAAAYAGNGTTPMVGADAALHSAATQFATALTKATGKTVSGGGVVSGYRHIIALGANAERVRKALAARVEYWQGEYDSKVEGESATDAKARRDLAARYITPASCDGDKPKHNGRPGATINGVVIEPGRGTNRTSQYAAAAVLYATHGDRFLESDVLDAFLDNGGKVERKDTLESAATKAYDSVYALVEQWGGRVSGDGAILSMALAVLGKARDTGAFTPAVGAAPVLASSDAIAAMASAASVAGADSVESGGADTVGADTVESVAGADTLTGGANGADSILGDVVGDLLDKPTESLTGLATPPAAPPAPPASRGRRGRGSVSPT